MSLSYDMLRTIAGNGSNLVLDSSISYDVLRELVAISKQTGAQITIPGDVSYDLVRELTAAGGKNVTVVNK